MATTGFWPVKGSLKDVVKYAENPDKTTNPKYLDDDLAAALKTEIEGKVNSADCGDIISHNASEFAVANHNHKIEDLTQTDYIIFNCGSSSTVI